MEQKLLQKIEEIFQLLAQDQSLKALVDQEGNINLKSGNDSILQIKNSRIISTINNIEEKLSTQKSSLKESFYDLQKIKQLIQVISESNSFVRLNHLGFCYKVDSIEKEREELKGIISKTDLHLYEEWSDENRAWFFYGNIEKNWQDPLIELIPVVESDDKRKEYWIPQIQIDIDTKLSQSQIESFVSRVFGNKIIPHPIIIDGVTYIMGIRLGIINGVNIQLDLATNNRQVQFHREKLLKVLV